MTFEDFIGPGGIEALTVAAAGRIDAHREPARGDEIGEAPGDRDGVRQLAPEIIDQRRQRLVREHLAEHLRGPHSRTGIADQGVRHRAETMGLPEEPGRRVGGTADKTHGARLTLRQSRADGGGVGHHRRHFGAGAVPSIHRHEGDFRQIGAHCISVVGGNASGAQLLQQHGFEIDEVVQ